MRVEAGPEGFELHRFERIGSTSDYCKRLARDGAPDGTAVLAAEQTLGRGTNGRHWESPAGNLYLSVLLRPRETAAEATTYALLAGVALCEALEGFLPSPAMLSLKWPNDVMLRGAKLGGVLIETATTESGRVAWLVVGFGANLAVAPSIPDQRTACLAAAGGIPTHPLALARAVLARLDAWCKSRQSLGFGPTRAAWLARAFPLGTPLTITAANGERDGRFAGLDADGALLLETGAGIERCVSGRARVSAEASPCFS